MILFPNRENLPVSPGCTMFHHFVSSGQFRNVNSRECDHRMKVDTPGNHHAVIPQTFEFDRFLCQKLTNLSLKILNRTPAMPFSPPLWGSFIDLTIGLVHYITETTFSHASTFTNFCGTSYPVRARMGRSIQNAPSINGLIYKSLAASLSKK